MDLCSLVNLVYRIYTLLGHAYDTNHDVYKIHKYSEKNGWETLNTHVACKFMWKLSSNMHFHYPYDISQEHGKTILIYKFLILINAKFYSYISLLETKGENIFMALIGTRTILFPTSTSGYFI